MPPMGVRRPFICLLNYVIKTIRRTYLRTVLLAFLGPIFAQFASGESLFSLERPYAYNGNSIQVCGRARGTHSKIAEPRSSYYEIDK